MRTSFHLDLGMLCTAGGSGTECSGLPNTECRTNDTDNNQLKCMCKPTFYENYGACMCGQGMRMADDTMLCIDGE